MKRERKEEKNGDGETERQNRARKEGGKIKKEAERKGLMGGGKIGGRT